MTELSRAGLTATAPLLCSALSLILDSLYPPDTMSIIQQHNADSLSDAWRTINIDALEEDSPLNFDIKTLRPPVPEITEPEVRQLATQVRQLLRAGDNDGALRGCLEMPVYVGTDAAKDAALQTVIEVLQSIKASDMSPLLKRLYESDNGSELLDVLMKYLYAATVPLFSFLPPSASFSLFYQHHLPLTNVSPGTRECPRPPARQARQARHRAHRHACKRRSRPADSARSAAGQVSATTLPAVP